MNRMSVAAALKAAPGRAGDSLSNFGQSAINFFDSMQRPTQGTIRIAGELVQVDEKGFNPAAYYDRVSFSKEYFPGVTGELLKQHAALFKRVFNNEDYPMNPKNPLPPCDKDEMEQITLGLKNRFKKLAEEIDVLEGSEHDTGVLRTKIKQLSKLKEFIYMLEKNAADDMCNPYGGAPTPGFGKDDAEENDKLRNTLRRFIIFLLQNKKRLDEYQNEYGSLADIVMPVIGDDKEITSETLSKYVNDWRKKHRSELPSLLIQILGITGEKSDLFEKKIQQELRELADKIRKDVMMRTATGGGEVQEGGVDISDVKKRISEIMKDNTDPAQMITALVSYIVTALEKNETETTSLETQKIADINKIKELAEKLKSSENSLAFTQETMAKLQEAKAAAEKSAIELTASDSEKKNRLQLLETTYKSATTAAEAMNKQLLEEKQAIQTELDAARVASLENSTKISEKAVELAALQTEYSTLKERFQAVFNTNAELQKQSDESSKMLAQLVADKVALVDEELRMRRQLDDLLKEVGKTQLKPEDYPAALGFAKELGTLQAGGGEKELLEQVKGLQADLAAAKAAQDETIKTKGEENAALKIQITGLEEQVANSLKECAARKCGSVIEIETKAKEKDAKILQLIKGIAEKEAVAAKLQSELTKCTDLSAVEKGKYEATIKSQLEQLSAMKEADKATILKLQGEGRQMLEKEKAATAAAKAEVKKKWDEIVRLKAQIEGLSKNKLVDVAKRAAAASAGPGSRPGTPKLPGSRSGTPKLPGSRPGTPKANGSRPGTPKANGSRPGTPKAPGSRPGTPKAPGSRPGTPKANGSTPGTPKGPGSRPGTPKAPGSRPGTPKGPGSPKAPPTTEPATTEPATTESATTEPATTEPATTEPATLDQPERTCTSIAAELKALAKKTMLAKLNKKLPEAANIQKQKQLGAESLRLGCSDEQSQNPSNPPVTPAKRPPVKPAIKTYDQIGASFEKTLRAILMQIKKGNGAIIAAAITEDISQYGSINKELKGSPIAKLITSNASQSDFFNFSSVTIDPTAPSSKSSWNSYFTSVWNDVWNKSISKKNLKIAPYPKTKTFLKKFIMDIFKTYLQQYNIEGVSPDATLIEKASAALPQFKKYIGDILIDLGKDVAPQPQKQKLYTLLGITDKMLTDYLST